MPAHTKHERRDGNLVVWVTRVLPPPVPSFIVRSCYNLAGIYVFAWHRTGGTVRKWRKRGMGPGGFSDLDLECGGTDTRVSCISSVIAAWCTIFCLSRGLMSLQVGRRHGRTGLSYNSRRGVEEFSRRTTFGFYKGGRNSGSLMMHGDGLLVRHGGWEYEFSFSLFL
ncbi:hypothetical protein BR93DRAFT_405202 [Coniochaeta sp. PMI_546]|nr:hypothetical protein BR93DRAFT_405202 [Coniochaeta sp. PMI_546]